MKNNMEVQFDNSVIGFNRGTGVCEDGHECLDYIYAIYADADGFSKIKMLEPSYKTLKEIGRMFWKIGREQEALIEKRNQENHDKKLDKEMEQA